MMKTERPSLSYAMEKAHPAWLTWSLALLTIAAFLALRHYVGITRDGVLYAAQALRYNDPSVLGKDLFFVNGSQDRFTIFSPLYGGLIRLLGLDLATRLVMALGQALWLLCALALVKRIVPPNLTWLTMLFIAAYPPYYGGFGTFSVAESVVTPRIFSEALGLAAIATFLGARPVRSGLLLAGAAFLHPLMAAAPAGAIIITGIFRRRQPWVPAAAMAAGAVVLLLAILATHRLQLTVLPTIDSEWMRWVDQINAQLFIGLWTASDWSAIVGNALLVGLACIVGPPAARPLFVTILAMALISLPVSFIGFEVAGDLLLGQVQVWRSLWLLTVLAPISIALIIAEAAPRPTVLRTAVLLFAYTLPILCGLAEWAGQPIIAITATLMLVIYCICNLRPQSDTGRSELLGKVAYPLFALLFVICLVKGLAVPTSVVLTWQHRLQSVLPVLILGLGTVLFLLGSEKLKGGAIALASVLLGVSLVLWDGRDDWQRYIEGEPQMLTQIDPSLGPEASVYWPLNIAAVWFGLKRRSFFDVLQGSGLIFHRDTAAEFYRRYRVVDSIQLPFDWATVQDRVKLKKAFARPVTLEALLAICRASDGPDIVVLEQNFPELRPTALRTPVELSYPFLKDVASPPVGTDVGMRRIRDFFVYRCADAATRSGAATND